MYLGQDVSVALAPFFYTLGPCPAGYKKVSAGTKSEGCQRILTGGGFIPVTGGIVPINAQTIPTWESIKKRRAVPEYQAEAEAAPEAAEGTAPPAVGLNLKTVLPLVGIAAALFLVR